MADNRRLRTLLGGDDTKKTDEKKEEKSVIRTLMDLFSFGKQSQEIADKLRDRRKKK